MSENGNAQRAATIAVLVENEAGVLARVIGLFSGRGFNSESLNVPPGTAAAGTAPPKSRPLRPPRVQR